MLKSAWLKLHALPRDGRDTLFLLAVIGWVVLPQVGRLPVWCSVLTAGVLLWRGRLAWLSRPLPGRWWLLGLLAATIAATLLTHRTLMGREAGVTLIVVLLALKTLELRARRDAFVIFFLGFFTMLTNFLSSQSLLTAAAMLVALLGLLTALVNAHMPVGKPPLAQAARTAGGMALLGAPIMVVLFLLFPRLAPLWGIPSDATTGRSGLSSSMQVGNIASLALDDTIAMRIRFEGPVPRQEDLYFRGPVLTRFDGREWLPLDARQATRLTPGMVFGPTNLQYTGEPVRYQVTLEPSSRPWLMTLDVTPRVPGGLSLAALLTPELLWLTDRPVTDITRYNAVAYREFRYGPMTQAGVPPEYLQLPGAFNPRTRQLAQDLLRDPRNASGTPALVRAAMDLLRNGGYVYTLEPGVYGQHTADEFWFDRKAGFCEHIASSFVVLMRSMGVPSRIVTGYQGGERNPVDGFWTLRQADAHAWAEVWISGQGWVRVDPTSAVSPGRIGAFQRLSAPQGVVAAAFGAVNPTLAANLRAVWEAVNNGWNQWVLNYTQSKQLDLLKNIGFTSPSWEDLSYVLLGLIVLASAGGAAWTLWERSRHDPWLRLLRRAQQRLQKAGAAVPPSAPPRQTAAVARATFGDAAHDVADWLLRLEAHRYAPRAQASLAKLQQDYKHIAWPQ